jgi:hypothetical protein
MRRTTVTSTEGHTTATGGEKTDVTQRAVEAGWGLPAGWQVLAWTERDDDHGDPYSKGDIYNADVDEQDYANPAHAFCKHCGQWITRVVGVEDVAAALARTREALPNAEDEAITAGPGSWSDATTGLVCTGHSGVGGYAQHAPDEPLAVRMWREDRWMFTVVMVEVVDGEGRVWGRDSLGSVEQGTFPYRIDRETGAVELREIDPVTDPDHPLPDMIPTALDNAREALAAHLATQPRITAPRRHAGEED